MQIVATARVACFVVVLSALAAAAPQSAGSVFTGSVTTEDGRPVAGAVVVSSAGGKAVTDAAGSFALEVELADDARDVRVTAVRGAGATRVVGSTSFDAAPLGGTQSLGTVVVRGGACEPSWLPTFGSVAGVAGTVRALTVFDDGRGPALYAAGTFRKAGDVQALYVARWDGTTWSSLGSGVVGTVSALEVFDDGRGPALYAAGTFRSAGGAPALGIARWDGTSWSSLGDGLNGNANALEVFDDGSGPALYAAGAFSTAGGVVAANVARWDGQTWSALGGGLTMTVQSFAIYDDGSVAGLRLFAGADSDLSNGTTLNQVSRWDDSDWTVVSPPANVSALAVYANVLYAAENSVGGHRVMVWNGGGWWIVGNADQRVSSLSVVVDPSSGVPVLVVGGPFTSIGGISVHGIARWDGFTWSGFGSGVDAAVLAVCNFDDGLGTGSTLYAGGNFAIAGGATASGIARWNGTDWSGLTNSPTGSIDALSVFDAGSGPELYVGGTFTSTGAHAANRVARWDGEHWSPLASGLDAPVRDLAVYDDGLGGGAALYAGGLFTSAGGASANRVARWNGTTWTRLGAGLSNEVRSLAVFDDGSGPALFVGGLFTTAGGMSARAIAKWNGVSWSALGSGMSNSVEALTVFDDGQGPALHAGGAFTFAGGAAANFVARWNGASWSPLGSGTNGIVRALQVFDDGFGGGPALHVGGAFTLAGGGSASSVARWDGTNWSALGGGTNAEVHALAVFDDGSGGGPALHAAGAFTLAGGAPAKHLARWDGTGWARLGGGTDGLVRALAVFDDGDGGGPALYAGGDFASASDSGDSYLARWQGCVDTLAPVIDCPPSLLVHDPLQGAPGEFVAFAVSATDDRAPAPAVRCTPRSGSFFPRGTTRVTCTATDAAGNRSTCEFEVTVQAKIRQQ